MSSVAGRDARVRAYLEELETALQVVSASDAAELMEQITAHIDEALPPDSSEATVVSVLRRLGSPAKLAAEAQSPANRIGDTGSAVNRIGDTGTVANADADPQSAEAIRDPQSAAVRSTPPARQLRHKYSRRRWSAIVAGLAIACVLTTFLVLYLTAPSLTLGGSSTWWSPQDQARAVISSTLGAQASTVPARREQWQGFVFEVENTSSWAQTILGVAPSGANPSALIGMAGVTDVEVSVSTYANYNGGAPDVQGMHFTAQQTIEPGQFRFIRVLWKTDPCSLSSGAGLTGSDQLNLEVRVGWISREEDLTLLPGWQLSFGSDCPSN